MTSPAARRPRATRSTCAGNDPRSLVRLVMDRRSSFAAVTEAGSAPAPVPAADPTSVHLVASARGGDARAFDVLYRRFAPLVHGVLIGGLRRDEVDDAVQEVFLSAWRS